MEKAYKLKEVEEMLGVSRRTLYNYIKEERLEAIQLPSEKGKGQWRVTEAALQNFIQGK